MEKLFLGIDTSCYTTSVALVDLNGNLVREKRKVLDVPLGKRGLAQSEMIFQHTRAFPELFAELMDQDKGRISGIGISAWPRRQEGSYMPAFLSGLSFGKSLATALGVPFFLFSHQEGHFWSGIQENPALLGQPMIGIQSSGGTLEGLRIDWQEHFEMNGEIYWEGADISLGQLIDRIGVVAGLPFPAGPNFPAIDLLAFKGQSIPVSLKDGNIFLAGAETDLLRKYGENPEELLSRTLYTVAETLRRLIEKMNDSQRKILLVGGVLANESIRTYLRCFFGEKLYFASPQYSSDSAVGIGRGTLERWKELERCGNK